MGFVGKPFTLKDAYALNKQSIKEVIALHYGNSTCLEQCAMTTPNNFIQGMNVTSRERS